MTSRIHWRILRQCAALAAAAVIPLLSVNAQTITWSAFNDNTPGPATSPNATTYGLTGSGPLKDIANGQNLSVSVTHSNVGVATAGTMAAPTAGTPADTNFSAVADWVNSPGDDAGAYLDADADRFYITFTGLDPNMRYRFTGTSVRGNSAYTARITIVNLVGAASANHFHSAGVTVVSDFEVSYNSGFNTAGDIVSWDFIDPGADGEFTIECRRSTGQNAYGIDPWRLDEIVTTYTPVEITQQPVATNTVNFRPFSLSVTATGTSPKYQWYKDDVAIEGATASTYYVASATNEVHEGDYYVVVNNPISSVTSARVRVNVNADSVPPTAVRAAAMPDFNTFVVDFSEKLDKGTAEDTVNYALSGGLGVIMATLTNNDMSVLLYTDMPQSEDTVYTLSIGGVKDLAQNDMVSVDLQARSCVVNQLGGLLFEVFGGTGSGNVIADLTNNAAYPDRATASYALTAFNTDQAIGSVLNTDPSREGYGGRIRGWFIPPLTGKWRLFLLCDDGSEMYFNPTGASAAGKQRVAYSVGVTGSFQNPPNTATSEPYDLLAGQAYYIEAIYKEGTGGDYFSATARMEGDTSALYPMGTNDVGFPNGLVGAPGVPASVSGPLTVVAQPADASTEQPNGASFTFAVTDPLGGPIQYQWQRDDGFGTFTNVANASGRTLVLASTLEADDNGARFQCTATNAAGGMVSTVATLTVLPDTTKPRLLSASRLADGVTILVTYSEPMDPNGAADPISYKLCNAFVAEECIGVLGATMTNNDTQVLLATEAPVADVTYLLTAYTLEDVIFDKWNNALTSPSSVAVAMATTFQQGDANGYAGTVDTNVRQDQPTTTQGANATVLADNLSPLSHGLLRFENIFGSGPGQIPQGSIISSATLRLRTDNWGNDIRVHRMLVPWDNNSTWNNVGSANDGVSLAAGDAVSTQEILFATVAVGSFVDVDVTASVWFWATNGGPNYGWALIDSGDDGYQFNSSEATDSTYRPTLIISFAPSIVLEPVVIVTQPEASTTLNEGQGFTLTVSVTGTKPAYQWFKDDAEIPGATAASYSVTGANETHSGKYYCKVSNQANSVQSADAMVTVNPDRTPPTVLSAKGGAASSVTVVVTFSEAVDPATADTAANYEIIGSGGITVLSAVSSGATVTLTLSGPRAEGENFNLRIKDVLDRAAVPNVLSPNPTTVPLATLLDIVGINSQTWKYLQQNAAEDPSPCLDGIPWTAPGYDDSAWATGLGVFYGNRDIANRPATLDGSAVNTYVNMFTTTVPAANTVLQTNFYFRTTFTFPSESTNGATLLVHSMIDDGAVFYLNGNRVGDVRYIADPALCTNFSASGGNQTWEPALASAGRALGLTGLVPGQNTLAVQVAQNNSTSSDLTFGLLVQAEVLTQLPPAPVLTYAYDAAAGMLTLTWTAAGYTVQEATAVTGPWTSSSAASGVPFAIGPGTKFYRLVK